MCWTLRHTKYAQTVHVNRSALAKFSNCHSICQALPCHSTCQTLPCHSTCQALPCHSTCQAHPRHSTCQTYPSTTTLAKPSHHGYHLPTHLLEEINSRGSVRGGEELDHAGHNLALVLLPVQVLANLTTKQIISNQPLQLTHRTLITVSDHAVWWSNRITEYVPVHKIILRNQYFKHNGQRLLWSGRWSHLKIAYC